MRMMAQPHPKMLQKMYVFFLWLINRKKTHGYGLIKLLKEGGFSHAEPSRLYPLLNNMLNEKLISQSKESQGKRIRKVYVLTAKGKKKLKDGGKVFPPLLKEFLKEMIK